jgi:hypothetical protein
VGVSGAVLRRSQYPAASSQAGHQS